MTEHQHTGRRKVVLSILTFVIVSFFIIVLAEFTTRMFNPQPTMFPRREFSSEYGFMNYANKKTIHEMPGKWRFIYTTNKYRNRGKAIPISNSYETPNIIILGDSNSFGAGVNDGEEFPSILANILKNQYNITNLSTAGWGLTQQIRRFYEFGQLYAPKIVLLQFSKNDLADNFVNQVTVVENGAFRFVNSSNKFNFIKVYLSNSLIQKSQLYNLLRHTVYYHLILKKAREKHVLTKRESETSAAEAFYMELLQTFVQDLNRRGILLLMISVNDELDQVAPNVKKQVLDFDNRGFLNYIEVNDFFEGLENHPSPEGHQWDNNAHHILGEKLAEVISSTQPVGPVNP